MYSLILALSLTAIYASEINGELSRCIATSTNLDVIFMVDSSGSVMVDNWHNELSLVSDIIENVLPTNSRVGLINFSGCSDSFDLAACKAQNRLKEMLTLDEYDTDLAATLAFVETIGEDDFNGGYTWINAALTVALDQFTAVSPAANDKMIILLSDGAPFPVNQYTIACNSTGYVSPTLTALNALGVDIVTVGIDITEESKQEYYDCISEEDFYFDGTFEADYNASIKTPVEELTDEIGEFICAELGSTRSVIPTSAPEPTPLPTPAPTTSPVSLAGECEANGEVDIIFIVDSSGSVYDAAYANWQAELDLVSDIVETLPENSRAGLINFSGCGPSYSLEACLAENRLKTEFELTTYGSPNDLTSVYDRISAMGSDDFNGGYTWTNEALGLALAQFTEDSDDSKAKFVVLLTDGEPYPTTENNDHEACIASTDYVSPTLAALNDLDVNIITVGIDMAVAARQEKLECMGSYNYEVAEFSKLSSLSVAIGAIICDGADGDFSTMSLAPTPAPTGQPTASMSDTTASPTPSPIIEDLAGDCQASGDLDVIFMIDSSGSVYDSEFKNWQAELDTVQVLVNSLPVNSRASLINFSGCSAQYTLEQCQEQGRLEKVFALDAYGTPNDLDQVSDRIGEMGSGDFKSGYTWTNQALTIALDEFNTNSDDTKTKVIVLLTDGEPFPYESGAEVCIADENYISPTLAALIELDVNIITVGIGDFDETARENKLDCMGEDNYDVDDFSDLPSIYDEIGESICDTVDGDFEVAPTSNGITNGIFFNLAIIAGFIAVLF